MVFAGLDTLGKQALFSSDGTVAGSHELSLPGGLIIEPNSLPVIGALPELLSSPPCRPCRLATPRRSGPWLRACKARSPADMTKKTAGTASSRAAILPGPAHYGTALGVLNPHAAMIVPDPVRLLHHIA